MQVVVCIPWIETSDPWRTKAREWTASYWNAHGAQVVYGLDDSRPVNRSRARNNASRNVDADVLFFADADMWVPIEQLAAAAERAHATQTFVHAYTSHTRISKKTTEALYEGKAGLSGQTITNTPHGAIAVPRAVLDAVGGHDERFTGWGYEDRCFQFACDTIAGPGSRIAGPSYHLYHPRGADQIRTTPHRLVGRELALRYKRAAGVRNRAGIVAPTKDAEMNREAMLAILKEPGGPLAASVESVHG